MEEDRRMKENMCKVKEYEKYNQDDEKGIQRELGQRGRE